LRAEKRTAAEPLAATIDGQGNEFAYSNFMAAHVQVVRCKSCKRRYYASESVCPECGRKSTKGWLVTGFIVLCFVLAIGAAAWLAIFMVQQSSKPEPVPHSSE